MVSVALLFGTSCESTHGDTEEVRRRVNATRALHGLPALRAHTQLDLRADLWAQHLRNTCALFHSDLRTGMPPRHRGAAENVGTGPTIALVHGGYLASPGHRRHILDRSFTHMGAAAVWGTCRGQRRVFTVHVFLRG